MNTIEELAEVERQLLSRDFLYDDPATYRDAVVALVRELQMRLATGRVRITA